MAHDPERAEQMFAARSAPRRDKNAKPPIKVPPAPKTLDDAVAWSSWAMHAVAVGDVDARTGHEIGYLVNAFKAAVEKRDLQREIDGLRSELDAMRKPRAS